MLTLGLIIELLTLILIFLLDFKTGSQKKCDKGIGCKSHFLNLPKS